MLDIQVIHTISKIFNWIYLTQLYIYFFSAITHRNHYHELMKNRI